jgi:quinoprotein glucose dehydrogenase
VPGERASATQPIPTRPPPFDRQGVSEDELIDFTPALRAAALEFVKPFQLGALYTPPLVLSEEGKRGTLTIPGAWGAGNWHTGAFDPETGMYYAVSLTLPSVRAVSSTKGIEGATMDYAGAVGVGQQPPGTPGFIQGLGPQVQGLPIVKPPYGRITAFNLKTGDLAWMVPNGDGPRSHPLLKDLNLPPLGIPNRPAPLLTRTLLFIGEGSDAVIGTPQVEWAWGKN